MPRAHKAKQLNAVVMAGLTSRARRVFAPEILPLDDIKAVRKSMSNADRQALLTFDKNELHKRAVKLTRLDVDQAKEELAALPAGAAEHNRAGTGVKCACGEDCELEIEPKQLQATLLEQYAAAVKQMKQRGSCKSWRFDQDTPKFTSTHAFRDYLEEQLLKPELRHLLPKKAHNKELKQLDQLAKQLNTLSRALPMFGGVSEEEQELWDQLLNGSTDLLSKTLEGFQSQESAFLESLSQETACTDVYQMVHWVCSTLKVFASQHAQLLLHVDAKPELEAEGKLQHIDPVVLKRWQCSDCEPPMGGVPCDSGVQQADRAMDIWLCSRPGPFRSFATLDP